jgi:hypothetical protein
MGELNIVLSRINIVLEKHTWEAVALVLLLIYGPVFLRYLFRWACQGNKGRRFDDSKAWGQEL